MRSATLKRGVTVGVAVSLTLAAVAAAQRAALREVKEWGVAGFSAAMALPLGEFSQNVSPIAGGGGAFMTVFVDPLGLLGMRFEGTVLAHGHGAVTNQSSPFYNATTFITGFHVGPQITLGRGILRLHGYGGIGLTYLFTVQSESDECYYYCQAAPPNEVNEVHDITWSGLIGGGMLVRLGGSNSNVHLDMGGRILANGAARYFTEDPSAQPTSSSANVGVLYLGLTFGLRN